METERSERSASDSAPEPAGANLSIGPQLIERFMAFSGKFGTDSFVDKLDTQQLGKLIDQADEDSKRAHERGAQLTRYGFIFMIALLVAILILCGMFLAFQKGDLLREIIVLLIGGAGGSGIGFTVGRASVAKRE